MTTPEAIAALISLDDPDALRALHGDTVASWSEFHDALGEHEPLWDALTSPGGVMGDREYPLELGTCRICRSTIARELAEPDREAVIAAFRRAEQVAMGAA